MTPEVSDPLCNPSRGLCESCRNARVLKAKQGSHFYLCRLSAVNPLFPKYPRLPVLRCAGYDAIPGPAP
jgi:hypothetical protein